ncbi:MAG: alpha-ketoglutarate-dependent dioxygenase AlkB [Microthrixaceae bacterium]
MGARQLRLEEFSPDPGPATGPGAPRVRPDAPVERTWLDAGSWIDVGRHWLQGADSLFDQVTAPTTGLSWQRRRRAMYGRLVDEPRLTAELRLARGTPAWDGPLGDIVRAATERYGAAVTHLWANWYRSGDDAVAWHGDRIGRHHPDPVVVIVSLAGPRRFLVRPAPGRPGDSHRWTLHSGDLLVMGGACQRRWQHSVPRQRGGAERISLTFREPSAAPDERSLPPAIHTSANT